MRSHSYLVEEVRLEHIRISGKNTRAVVEDDDINDLAQSIAQKGLLQPVGVRADEDGHYRLLWGERRYRAHQRLRKRTITCHVYPENGIADEVLMAVENLIRQNHTLAEEVAWVRALGEQQGMPVEAISSMLNRSRGWVLSRIAVDGMQEHLREPLLEGDLKLRVVEEIARVGDVPTEKYIVARALQERLSASAVKQIVRLHQQSPAIAEAAEVGRAMERGAIPIQPVLIVCQICDRRIPVQAMKVIYVCADQDDCQHAAETNNTARPADEKHNGDA